MKPVKAGDLGKTSKKPPNKNHKISNWDKRGKCASVKL